MDSLIYVALSTIDLEKISLDVFNQTCMFCFVKSEKLESVNRIPRTELFWKLSNIQITNTGPPQKICHVCLLTFKSVSKFVDQINGNVVRFEELYQKKLTQLNTVSIIPKLEPEGFEYDEPEIIKIEEIPEENADENSDKTIQKADEEIEKMINNKCATEENAKIVTVVSKGKKRKISGSKRKHEPAAKTPSGTFTVRNEQKLKKRQKIDTDGLMGMSRNNEFSFNGVTENCILIEEESTDNNGNTAIAEGLFLEHLSATTEENMLQNTSASVTSSADDSSAIIIENLNNSNLSKTNVTIDENKNYVEMMDAKINLILENQANSKKDMLNIAQQLANLQVSLETFAVLAQERKNSSCKQNLTSIDEIVEDEIFFKPIDSLEDLEEFEKKLKDKNEMTKYLKKFTFVCGSNNNEGNSGLNNCYFLVDKIFTRKFFTISSWAGGTKEPTKQKIPFKIYQNTINFFHQVIKMSDESFTLKRCVNFLKSVIKNSNQRLISNLTRSSRTKKRPKNLMYKVKALNKTTISNNEEDLDNSNDIHHIIPEHKEILSHHQATEMNNDESTSESE